jgi:hypothetical protein
LDVEKLVEKLGKFEVVKLDLKSGLANKTYVDATYYYENLMGTLKVIHE